MLPVTMREELKRLSSSTQLSEQDLLNLLAERDACLRADDEVGYAECLVTLAHVVKWVRSDNAESPFLRANTLAREALSIFERNNHAEGTIDALIQAAPMAGPEAEGMLARALAIAESSGDGAWVARVLDRQAAHAGQERSIALTRRALEIYERLDNKSGQAACLFSLAIRLDDTDRKIDAATGAAELFREIGRHNEAAKSMGLVLMYGADYLDIELQRVLAEQGLNDAQAAGNRSTEGIFYTHLARIHAVLGDLEKAERYLRWEGDIEASDGLSPAERRKKDIAFTKEMVQTAKQMGRKDWAKMLQRRLRDLKKE